MNWPPRINKVILDASEQCFCGETNELLLKEWEKVDFLKEKKIRINNGKESFQVSLMASIKRELFW